MFDGVAQTFYRALMWAGSWWCHQLPARSPQLWGSVQAPLCWRCSGILLGTLVLFVWLLVRKRLAPLRLSLALAVLLPLDVFHAVITGGQGDNTRRLLTGILWGIFGTTLFLHFIKRAAGRLSPASSSSSSTPART